MALVDFDAAWADLKRELRDAQGPDGQRRSSWGRPQLLELLDELEVRNRVDESHDRKVLRRFAAALVDTFLGLLPRSSTDDPLGPGDRTVSREAATQGAMDGGEAIRSPQETEDDHARGHERRREPAGAGAARG